MADVSFRISATGDADRQISDTAAALQRLAAAESQAASAARGQVAAESAKGMRGAASAAGNLRFQIFDIGQGLASGVNPLVILNQQGAQVAQALQAGAESGATMGQTIRAALGPLVTILPVVAVAAAGVAVAYQGLTAASEEAAREQEILALGAKHTTDMLEDLEDSVRRLAILQAGGTEDALEYSDAWDRVAEKYKEATKESDALIEANTKILASKGLPDSWAETIAGVSRGLGDLAEDIDNLDGGIKGLAVNTGLFAFLTTALDGVSTSTAELKKETALAIGTQLQARAAAILSFDAAQKEKKATDDLTESKRKSTKARKEATMSAQEEAEALSKLTDAWIKAAAAEMDAERFAPPPVSEWQKLANELDGLVPKETLSDVEKLTDYLARIKETLGLGKITVEQSASLTAAGTTTLNRAQMEESAKLAAEAAAAASANMASQTAATNAAQQRTAGVAGTVGGALSDPLGTAASMHPIAAAVYAGMKSAAAMQDGRSVFTEAADLVNDALANLGPFVASAFEAVATIIGEAPRALVEAVPDIVAALADGIPSVITALGEAIPDVITALVEAIPSMIPDLVAALVQTFILAGPMLVAQVALAVGSAFLDPAFYEGIGEGFLRGIERLLDGLLDLGEGLVPTGGGFGQATATERAAAASGDVGAQVVVTASDIWTDFTEFLGVEDGAQGRR